MKIYCCGCEKKVDAILTNGLHIYPHRPDLKSLPFWKCGACKNYVGCHHKTKNRTAPLGYIATPELRKAKQHIHQLLDPIWMSKKMKRKEIYQTLTNILGWTYHTAKIKSVDEARKVYKIIQKLA